MTNLVVLMGMTDLSYSKESFESTSDNDNLLIKTKNTSLVYLTKEIIEEEG